MLKRLKAAYESASKTHKRSQEYEAVSPLQTMQGMGARGGRNTSAGGGGGGGVGTAVVTSAASSPSVTFGGGGGGGGGVTSSLVRRFTSTYSLAVGEDVDEVEKKFKATLDSEVRQTICSKW